uniref:Uncharacterized protein n=1 Tax=Trichuris muris TaxID=70415 RepID=A0A5S6QP62_TRIMR
MAPVCFLKSWSHLSWQQPQQQQQQQQQQCLKLRYVYKTHEASERLRRRSRCIICIRLRRNIWQIMSVALKLIAFLLVFQIVLSIGPAERRIRALKNGPMKSRNLEGPFGTAADHASPAPIEALDEDEPCSSEAFDELDGKRELDSVQSST